MEQITRRENILIAYKHKVPCFIPSMSDCDICYPSALEEYPKNTGLYTDGWGVIWQWYEGQPGPIQDKTKPYVLNDITEWKTAVRFPNIESSDWVRSAAEDTASWDRENKISNVVITNGLWERFFSLSGFEEGLCNILIEPEASYDLLSAIADQKIEYLKKIAKHYRPDKIQFHDDYGTERSLIMSEDTWRELIKPNLKRIIEACHELGMIYEHYSGGYIVPIIEDLIEIGVDAWNPVQNINNPDILINKYKDKLTFVGAFNDRIYAGSNPDTSGKRESIINTIKTFGETGSWVPAAFVGEEDIDFINDSIHAYNVPKYQALGLSGPLFEKI